MAFVSGLSDDQLALLGCLAALVVSGGLLLLSEPLGRWLRGRSGNDHVVRLPRQDEDGAAERKAA